jgi:hypothetical protein
MSSYLGLLAVAAADVPTPPAGKVRFFLDSADGVPSFKNSAGTVTKVTSADPELAAIAALVSAANKVPMFSGSGTATLLDFDVDGTLAANSDTRIASQKAVRTYVLAQIAAVIDSSPGALDTLNELAAALGDDANFAASVTTALAGKADLAGDTFSGPVEVPDDAYDATGWNGSTEVPTKNALRDILEAIAPGGSPTLAALTDVDIPTPADDDVLTFKTASGKWEAHPAAGGGGGSAGGLSVPFHFGMI